MIAWLLGRVVCVVIVCMSTPFAALPVGWSRPAAMHDDRSGNASAILRVGDMTERRAAHSATALPDGTVLVAGGFAAGERSLASAEVYDPRTRSFRATGAMGKARSSHSATLLPDGTVLIAGGFDGDYLRDAEVYDPRTGTFAPTGAMTTARSGHVAVTLRDGRVLLVGGVGEGWTFLRSAELYDPRTRTFTATGAMGVPRESHTANVLPDGRVLVAGGHAGRRAAITIYDSAEIYDSQTGTFADAGTMRTPRHKHDAVTLHDGRVLIMGGADERDEQGTYRSAEMYDAQTGRFVALPPMHTARYKHQGTSAVLPNGTVLVAGGATTVELFDPATARFCVVGTTSATRLFATTAIVGGKVLFAGGYGSDIAASSSAWLMDGARLRCPNDR